MPGKILGGEDLRSEPVSSSEPAPKEETNTSRKSRTKQTDHFRCCMAMSTGCIRKLCAEESSAIGATSKNTENVSKTLYGENKTRLKLYV